MFYSITKRLQTYLTPGSGGLFLLSSGSRSSSSTRFLLAERLLGTRESSKGSRETCLSPFLRSVERTERGLSRGGGGGGKAAEGGGGGGGMSSTISLLFRLTRSSWSRSDPSKSSLFRLRSRSLSSLSLSRSRSRWPCRLSAPSCLRCLSLSLSLRPPLSLSLSLSRSRCLSLERSR